MQYSFRPIALADKPALDAYFLAEEYDNSELCFGNMFLWKDSWHIEFCITPDDILLLRGRQPTGERFFFPPILKEPSRIDIGMNHCIAASYQEGQPFLMYGVTERIVEHMRHARCEQDFLIEEDRNNFDYVYNTADLIALSGSRYHAKRNHINKLRATVQTQYVRMCDALVEPCFASYMLWYDKRQAESFDPSLEDEKVAVRLALDNWRALEFDGGALTIDGRVEAFSLGERRKCDMAIIHIEKANTDYPGLYAMINQQTAENVFCDVRYLNREEDMGIPGLRRAKESYHPCRMVRKFIVRQRV
jgi:hypothetical protein